MARQAYDIFCSNQPGEICPVKVELVKDVTGDPTGQTRLKPVGDDARADRILTGKLWERNLQGQLRRCSGPEELSETIDCPVREQVNADPVRRVVVDSLRTIVRRVRHHRQTTE